MRSRPRRAPRGTRTLVACLLSLALPLAARPARAQEGRPLLGRADAIYAAAATAAILVTAHNDLGLRDEAIESNSSSSRTIARLAQPFGNPVVICGAIAAGYGIGRLRHSESMRREFGDLAWSVIAAGGEALALKEAVGRSRPRDTPEDPGVFRPFSGQESFPSGHATLAFATAESIELAWHRGWTRWVTYPAAAVVGWSRVRDDWHWTSDVVAGAALGIWTAHKVSHFRAGEGRHVGFELLPVRRGVALVFG